MKDYVNPVLLVVVVMMMACRAVEGADAIANKLDIALMTLCLTCVLVNGALGLARALTHRPSVGAVLWAGCFFVLGCVVWTLPTADMNEEQVAYRELYQAQRENPLARDAEGENLLTRAAALGKADTVRDILKRVTLSDDDICEAGVRAAEGNSVRVLELLAARGLNARASANGTPLLHAAAQNAARDAMAWLLARGAMPNSRDAEGATPLIHAVIAESAPAVRLLLDYGADPALKDVSGKGPRDYARSDEMLQLLSSAEK